MAANTWGFQHAVVPGLQIAGQYSYTNK